MSKWIFILLIAVLAFFTGFQHKPLPYKNFTVQELAPGVFAVINNDKGGHAICNAGIIDLGDKTVVFDAFINVEAALELKKTAEQLTHHPVSFLINSHFHNDHIRGNQIFVPGASIISTEWTRDAIRQHEPEEQEWEKKNVRERLQSTKDRYKKAQGKEKEELPLWIGYYEAIAQSLPVLKTTLPNIAFRDSLWLHGSKRSVLLREFKMGHTGSDVVLILPKEGVVFMGDLFFVKRHPWFGDGNPDSLKKHLEGFYNDSSLTRFVPGHGPVGGKADLQSLVNYISDLQREVSDAVAHGDPDSLIIRKPILPAYQDWWFGQFYSPNLQFLCKIKRDN